MKIKVDPSRELMMWSRPTRLNATIMFHLVRVVDLFCF